MTRFFNLIVLSVAVATVFATADVSGQEYFGRNKVTYRGYDWHFLETEHFIIHFDKNSQSAAQFCAKEAERSLVHLEKDLKYTLKNRYPIVIYNSHNGFSVSNILPQESSEFTGGYTEFARGRVVIPYTGSYADFRHVIHHELAHVVTLEMWTGGGWLGAMISQSAAIPPLWIAEGVAEFLSRHGWDQGADNFMRHATIAGYVPPIMALNGPFAYKGGQSVFVMIDETYGKDKVAEFISAFKSAKGVDKAMKSSVGIGIEKLNEKWQLWLKRQYWNDINNHNEPEEIGKILTDDLTGQGFYNVAPSFSPQGDKIAYVTEREGTFDIYLMSAIDGQELGRLVEGERSSDFESMFVLRPGITWSPDGQRIAFAAKSNNKNTLYILDVKKRKVKKRFKFDLDGLFEPAWSPDGKQIAVAGLKDGWSDIYIVNLEDESLRRITNDPYDEKHLDWSPDGKWLVVSSDRPKADLTFDGKMDFPFGQYDIYLIRPDGSDVRRVTTSEVNDLHPTWGPDSKHVAFVSNRTGVGNIYIAHIDSSNAHPITNLLSSVQNIDWSADGKKMVFNTYHKSGYHIFVMKDPQSQVKDVSELPLTRYEKRLRGIEDKSYVEQQKDKAETAESDSLEVATEVAEPDTATLAERKVEKWVSDQMTLAAAEAEPESDGELTDEEASDRSVTLKDWNKEFQINKYRVKLKPEFFGANAGFDTFYGVSSQIQLQLTDMLGDHRVTIQSGLSSSIKDSDLFLSYVHLARQTNYAMEAFHTRSFFITNGQVAADRIYGGGFGLERPFNRFTRFELSTQGINISRELLGVYSNPFVSSGFTGGIARGSGTTLSTTRAVVSRTALVDDNAMYSLYGPVKGRRARLAFEGSWAGMKYGTVQGDYRKYALAFEQYTFAFRLSGGTSYGPNRQVFFLGGVNNAINPNFATFAEVDQDRIFFSSYVWPLRGVELFEMAGDSYVLTNLAFRFPLLHQVAFGWPLPLLFQNIQGELFMDVGSAFNRGDFDPWEAGSGGFELRDLRAGYGLGVRVNTGMFLFRYDLAWPTDFAETFGHKQYFSMDITGLF